MKKFMFFKKATNQSQTPIAPKQPTLEEIEELFQEQEVTDLQKYTLSFSMSKQSK